MKQQRRQGADHQNDRQGAKGEDEGAAGAGLGEGQRPAAEIAEDEARARRGRLLQRLDAVVEHEEDLRRMGRLDEQQGQRPLQDDPAEHDAQGNAPAVLAQRPGEEEEGCVSEKSLHARPRLLALALWRGQGRGRRGG